MKEINDVSDIDNNELQEILRQFNSKEREAWIAEVNRLVRVIERYRRVKPKRRINLQTGKYEFIPEILELCESARCVDSLILKKEPHRANAPSPHTLDRWAKEYRDVGLVALFRDLYSNPLVQIDQRRSEISIDAIKWLYENWRTYKSPRYIYKALKDQAEIHQWKIPSESWLYRQWRNLPEIVRVYYLEGAATYESKFAPYVPRDFTNLAALQVLCGDHSERKLFVRLKDGTIKRPWLTVWLELRAGLIWGWHLDLTPSSQTAAFAYANGVETFGAQPFSRPEDEFYSYVYTDRGRDYLSHNWDGKVIDVHKCAMQIDGGLEFVCYQQRVGILDDLSIHHLIARGHNPKEKPVERLFKDLTNWEENSFKEFCGRTKSSKPDEFLILYEKHRKLSPEERITESPFITFEDYRERLANFILGYNSSSHTRSTLGGAKLIPLNEYKRLYTTRYEISSESLSLLLMHGEKRQIRKNGVQCFQSNWFYYHEAMSEFKGTDVEVRYTDDDYTRVWVLLPDRQICEAVLITPTSLINPDKRTLSLVSNARANEKKVIREAQLIQESNMKGERTEDRIAKLVQPFVKAANFSQMDSDVSQGKSVNQEESEIKTREGTVPTTVHRLTRMDRPKLLRVVGSDVTGQQMSLIEPDFSIFTPPAEESVTVKEFGYEEVSNEL